MHISLDLLSLGSAEAYIGWGGKLNDHLLASYAGNICTKNYQNLLIVFQVTVKNVGDALFGTQCTCIAIFHTVCFFQELSLLFNKTDS